ncbi:UvrD-helicase domain-containing protein, partial [Planctomycetota bacterium]
MTAVTSRQDHSPSTASPNYSNELIRASAGTGKTFHLSNRYLRLVLNDVPVTQILATTFTRQAAREILDRILFRLATAAETDESASDLAMALGIGLEFASGDTSGDTSGGEKGGESFRDRCMRKLRELTASLPRLRVSTLDAFFAQIAQSYSLEIGLPPGWRIVEETEETAIRNQAIDRYLGIGKPERVVKLMHLLSKGKAERSVSRMIADTVIDLHSLYLDSDLKAWKRLSQVKMLDDAELEEAVMALSSCDTDQLDVVKAFKPAKEKDCNRAAAGQWDSFLANGIAKKLAAGQTTFGRGAKNTIPESLEALYQPLVQHAVALMRNQVVVQTESTYTLLDGFDTQYQDLKHRTRSLRFDDINRSLLPFANGKAFQQIAFRMNDQINHLLLDEFQDTSLDQWRVIRPFARHVATDGSKSFFCVGDVKQAIYGWRGGDADILNQMHQQLPDIEAMELADSYRSSSVVIDFVNQVNRGIANHPSLNGDEQKASQDWCDAFPQHATARKELPGYVTMETARVAVDEDDSQVDLVLDRCADRVSEVVRACPTASVAVLTRSNDAVGKMIFRLQQRGVGASELGGNPLTDSAAVQVILSRLRIADHPGDSAAFFHLQNSPWANELGI